ncbi:MAG TPA: hypothetical protein VMJ10_22275 [Kofleriaceae bacterium]|nr:hypothetical protein [Kofleriaceae bacterium]
MTKLWAAVLLVCACQPTAYYVANLFVDQSGQLITQRCAIDNGRNSDKPDPANCRYERVGPPPPEVQALIPAAPPPSAPPPSAPPPAAPPPAAPPPAR